MNIKDYFAPKSTDVEYVQEDQLKISLICRIDSYKFSHPFAYPKGIQAMTSYGEARIKGSEIVVPFGMQLLVKRYLSETITAEDVEAAEAFALAHFGRPLFHKEGWMKVVNVYNGKLPLIIRAVKEGTVMHGSQPIYTVTVFDEDLYWMSAGFETMIQRGIWYPTTIATFDYVTKQEIIKRYKATGANLDLVPFALHDFGGRGVSSGETAEIGGAAHLVNFMGSDTVEGILTANFYYKCDMAGFSVYATEHSIQCSFGPTRDNAIDYLRTQIRNATPGSIFSVVIDGYDVFREAEILCTELKDEIIASGAKVVFRPDSGDMMEIVPALLKMQEDHFGVTLTETGHKRINYVGMIQGDGISHTTLIELLDKVIELGYSADVIIFGSGGALLQKVNRDTLKFAQKACSILIDGEWKGIAKDPITDQGKKSKEGILTLARNLATGELETLRIDDGFPEGYEDAHFLVYYLGKLFNEITLAEVRENAA
ncbi:MAG: nicotinate phosphoribosyltransferase [Gammaproteobacteria bacterium]|nr:nicotinate phosphoribosyltransferase [Gammaproteobacteria bacterium]